MKAVLLDADTLGSDIDLAPLRAVVTELQVFAATTPAQLAAHLTDADIVLTNKVVIPASAMTRLKAICVLATGTNNIDAEAAAARGIPVMNVTGYGTESVAQHTLMLMLALAARLPAYAHAVRDGAWERSQSFCLLQWRTEDLAGKRLVIVGEGTLGRAVAERARALGMQVVFSARPGARVAGVADLRPELAALLPQADVISFHCPLTDATRHLLHAGNLPQLRPSCLVINCARGSVIDEVAALEALQAGMIGGLAVDVLPQEPPHAGHPLLTALRTEPALNLIVTPHNAWISPAARQAIIAMTAANISQWRGL